MYKTIGLTVAVVMMLLCAGCSEDKATVQTEDPTFKSIEIETIEVENIEVENIEVERIITETFDNSSNVTRWD